MRNNIMLSIPQEIQDLIQQQKVIVVASVDENGITNVSPRSAISCSNNVIYWLDFFSHKSQKNFSTQPWVSVAVFDPATQKGFQLKGKVTPTNEMDRKRIIFKIMKSLPNGISRVYQEIQNIDDVKAMMFYPSAVFSLDPTQNAGTLIKCDDSQEVQSLLC